MVALRLLPGALLELALALALLASCILLHGAALATVAVLVALVMAGAGLTRLLDRSPPGA